MTLLKKARFFLEYLMLQCGLFVIPIMPRRIIRALAKVGGNIAYICCRKLRHIALANLNIAFGSNRSTKELEVLARQSFCSTAQVMLDFLWFARHTSARITRYVSLDRSLEDSLAKSPFIGVTAHFGNWELLSAVTSRMGLRLVNVFADLKNPYVTRLLRRLRSNAGVELVRKEGAIKKLLKALRNGNSIGLLMDQNTAPRDGGVFMDFFGIPAPVSSAAGLLCERTGLPVVLFFCKLRQDGTYYIYSLLELNSSDCQLTGSGSNSKQLKRSRTSERLRQHSSSSEASEITKSILSGFEREISKNPEQWLWMYKRWKFISPGAPRNTYPFYSKRVQDF